MDRREFLDSAARGGLGTLGVAACGALPALSGCASAGTQEPPNILLILADDMGYADVGCYGGEIDTPNIDGLAEEGLRFSQFYNNPRCCPSRASLLTGLYTHQTGMGAMTTRTFDAPAYQGYLNDRCVTIAGALPPAGYRTAMVGKWHVGYKEPEHWPTRRGFERFYGEHRYIDNYFAPEHQLYLGEREVEPEGPDWYSTDAYTDYALQFMDEAHQDDEPFFMYVAYNAPHFPLQAFKDIEKYRGQYMKDWKTLREERHARQVDMGLIKEDWALSSPVFSHLSPETERVAEWLEVEDDSAEMWDWEMAAYAAQVDRMDQNIGRLLQKLDEMGVADNTLVLFFSDNGGCAEDWINDRNPEGTQPGARDSMLAYGPYWANISNTPFRLYKQWTHEGGIATPLIARWPDVVEDQSEISHEMGHLMDLMPTVLEAAGAEYPEARDGQEVLPVEGHSLLPLLQGGSREGYGTLCWEHVGNRAVRQGRWKLSSRGRFTEDEWELYDMEADRTETNDLAAQQPDRVRQHSQRPMTTGPSASAWCHGRNSPATEI